jgi:amino acid adenylation domain-containing protein
MSNTTSLTFGVSLKSADRERPTAPSASRQNDPVDMLVPQLVGLRAAATPNAVSVATGHEALTYAALDARSNQIAHCLRCFGVGPETVVGVCLERTSEMVIAALGVLKSGGAYLPLDPAEPSARLTFKLNDAQAQVVLTTEQLSERLGSCKARPIKMDSDALQIARFPKVAPDVAVSANNLAYVIYTSGSTGQPKGVEITHRSLLNLVCWHQAAFRVSSSDRASQVSALAFDATVWEIWPYLTAGASLHLANGVAVNDPGALRDWLISEAITIGFVPTPLAERLMMLEWPEKPALRVMLTGADTLHHYPSRTLPFQLVNNYGPTECTVVATSGTVLPNEHANQLPAIGKPISNVEVFILNNKMQKVAIGEAGEIYIGGAGLARGYRNRPDLTAERFILSSFSADPGALLYKTGDLASYLPDGQIAFLGRVDEQIKIRGFRVEPAEIVKALDEHPDVQASAVVLSRAEAGNEHLVAYFVASEKARPTYRKLHNFLAVRLPEYMLPATFIRLEALPLNLSGKIDRVALPEPNSENTLRDKIFVEPRTRIEERVSEIIAQLLNLNEVGAEDNFFLLGGHSLLGTQVVARVRDTFGIELSLRTLFDGPTVAELSTEIEMALVAKLEAMSDEEAQRIITATAARSGETNPK